MDQENIKSMTVKKLRDYLRDENIRGMWKMRKQELMKTALQVCKEKHSIKKKKRRSSSKKEKKRRSSLEEVKQNELFTRGHLPKLKFKKFKEFQKLLRKDSKLNKLYQEYIDELNRQYNLSDPVLKEQSLEITPLLFDNFNKAKKSKLYKIIRDQFEQPKGYLDALKKTNNVSNIKYHMREFQTFDGKNINRMSNNLETPIEILDLSGRLLTDFNVRKYKGTVPLTIIVDYIYQYNNDRDENDDIDDIESELRRLAIKAVVFIK